MTINFSQKEIVPSNQLKFNLNFKTYKHPLHIFGWDLNSLLPFKTAMLNLNLDEIQLTKESMNATHATSSCQRWG